MTLPILNAQEEEIIIEPYMDLTPYIGMKDIQIWKDSLDSLGVHCHPAQGPWIAGGAVRRFLQDEPMVNADIDLFFCGVGSLHQFTTYNIPAHLQKIKETTHHVTYAEMLDEKPIRTVQCITSRYFATLKEHLEHFDFTHCQAAWDGQRFIVTQGCYHALMTHTYTLTNHLEHPLGSWFRVLKYHTQGYTLRGYDLNTLMKRAAETLPDDTLPVYGHDSDNEVIKEEIRPGS